MSLLLAFLAGVLASQALEAIIVRAVLRAAARFPTLQPFIKQHAAEKGIDLKARGKILKTDEWMFKKKVSEGANPFEEITIDEE
jgi:hypothetical protein